MNQLYLEMFKSKLEQSLKDFGFAKLPTFEFSPKHKYARKAFLITGCSITKFDKNKHILTKTKFIYDYLDSKYILNHSIATALDLASRDHIIILQGSNLEMIKILFESHPKSSNIYFIEGDLHSFDLITNLYTTLESISKITPLKSLYFCLRGSYSSGLAEPFAPFFIDDVKFISRISEERISFFYNMGMVIFDLLLNKGQEDARIVGFTALASVRPSAHLLTDTIHKMISNIFLEVFALEIPYYTGKKVQVIEIAPGMIDTDIYDKDSTRESVIEESTIDKFPLENKFKGITEWPMISPLDLGEIATIYLEAEVGQKISSAIENKFSHLTTAGRSVKDFIELIKNSYELNDRSLVVKKLLPRFAYMPEVKWNGLPDIKEGYTLLPLTPMNQLF